MRRVIALIALTSALVGPAVPAFADSSSVKSTLSTSSANGGDQGWGNCGINSSGGVSRQGLGGNGGHKKGDTCVKVQLPIGPGLPQSPPPTTAPAVVE